MTTFDANANETPLLDVSSAVPGFEGHRSFFNANNDVFANVSVASPYDVGDVSTAVFAEEDPATKNALLNFDRFYKELRRGENSGKGVVYRRVPPGVWSSLPVEFRRRIKRIYADTMKSEYTTTADEIHRMLELFSSYPQAVSYKQYLELHRRLPQNAQKLVNPRRAFALLLPESDSFSRVPIASLQALYVETKMALDNRNTIESFVVERDGGTLNQDELESYVNAFSRSPFMDLRDLSSYELYVVRDALFTLFSTYFGKGRGGVRVSDIVTNSLIERIQEANKGREPVAEGSEEDLDEFADVFFNFKYPIKLNRLLSDLRGSGQQYPSVDSVCAVMPEISSTFIRRFVALENSGTKDTQANFVESDVYFRLILTMKCIPNPVFAKLAFNVIDVNGDGFFTIDDYKFFYDDFVLYCTSRALDMGDITMDNVFDELYDSCGVQQPNKITLDRILASRNAAKFFKTIFDLAYFAAENVELEEEEDQEDENAGTSEE